MAAYPEQIPVHRGRAERINARCRPALQKLYSDSAPGSAVASDLERHNIRPPTERVSVASARETHQGGGLWVELTQTQLQPVQRATEKQD